MSEQVQEMQTNSNACNKCKKKMHKNTKQMQTNANTCKNMQTNANTCNKIQQMQQTKKTKTYKKH